MVRERTEIVKRVAVRCGELLLFLWCMVPAVVAAEPPSAIAADEPAPFAFSLTAQFRARYQSLDRGPDRDRRDEARIIFRRIRPIFRGGFFEGDLTYNLHLNVVPGALELMDLWFDYRLDPQARVKVGQLKIPYTRYRLDSFKDLPVVEWSNVTTFFGAERQIGAMLHNGVSRPPAFEYQVGVFTGANARASHAVGLVPLYGEQVRSPSDLADPAPPRDLHPEMVLHAAYNHGDIDVRRPSDREGGEPRFSAGASVAWDAQPTAIEDLVLRVAPEAMFKAYGLALSAVFHLAMVERAEEDNAAVPGLWGGVAQASYRFCESYEVSLRYTVVRLLRSVREDIRRHANRLVSEAPPGDAGEAWLSRTGALGTLSAEHEANVGFNIYLLDDLLKWQIDGGLLVHDRYDGDLQDIRARTQFQLAF
jgi:hypothetical protein